MIAQLNTHCGDGLRMAPFAQLDDGVLDAVCVKTGTRGDFLAVFGKVKDGSHVYNPMVEYRHFRTMRMDPEGPPQDVNIDGEIVGIEPYQVEIQPKSWQFYWNMPE